MKPTGLRIAWITLLVIIVAAAATAAWMFVGSNQRAGHAAAQLIEQYNQSCQMDSDTGSVIGVLTIPAISDDSWPIIEYAERSDLAHGVAWYPETARPGENGNTAISGYRLFNGEPFADLLELQTTDIVTISTCTHTYTYAVEVPPADLTVTKHDQWVLDDVPGEAGRFPTGQMLTLITSQDLLPTNDRSVAMARLIEVQAR